MSLKPTYGYLVENAATFYSMKREMRELEPTLAQALVEGISQLATKRRLKSCLVQDDYGDDDENLRAADHPDTRDELEIDTFFHVQICDDRLILPSQKCVFLDLSGDVESLLTGEDASTATVSMSPLSKYLEDLKLAKSIWSHAGLGAVFERDRERGWTIDDNNRKTHTFWGAVFEPSLGLDPKELAGAWSRGTIEEALGAVDDLMATYKRFADTWVKRVPAMLTASRRRRAA